MEELDPPPSLDAEQHDSAPEIDEADTEEKGSLFPVVGLGASAGGLEAFTRVLENLTDRTGMAFVIVQHLWPSHSSLLPAILARATPMPVAEAAHKTQVQPNHVYVIPPNTVMRIANSMLELAVRPEERGAPRPIDCFFRSLAEDRKALAIGVLLSGSDSNGALGLQAIREEGGIAIAQSESSARNPAMPRSAVAAGTVDLILPPDQIGTELVRIANHPALAVPGRNAVQAMEIPSSGSENAGLPLGRLFRLLRGVTGVDFSGYKPGTLRRRIARRMLLQHQENFLSYLSWLDSNRAEVAALAEDVLIHVTGFFRDTEAFDLFEYTILPQLLKASGVGKADSNTPFRIWIPGCSTGQEVYSIAICLIEAMGQTEASFGVQIFGTDLSDQAIATARNAIYPESEVAKLSPERLARFFVRAESGFQVAKSVREMCVFARQNLLADPPFSRLNLISCRNVLIYMTQATQRQLIATFHYALEPGACLWLGHSESLRDFPELFDQIDKRQKFYSRKPSRDHANLQVIRRGGVSHRLFPMPSLVPENEPAPGGELERLAERLVLSEFGPPWVLVNENLEIVNSRGDVRPYLHVAPGRATLSLLRMASDEIRGELGRLLARAKYGEPNASSSVLHQESGGEIIETKLDIRRLTPTQLAHRSQAGTVETSFLVIFSRTRRRREPRAVRKPRAGNAAPEAVEELRHELTLANQRLAAILGERDAANQELISANEEIQSSNEELQSINEELETSKEELQSSNEELNTVNEELQNRNRELIGLSDDLANLLSSTTIPILMLDNDLRIRRVTPAAERLFNIRQTDVGRPISDIRLRLSEEDLDALVRRVIDTLIGEEIELPDRENRWHLLRVRPYRTSDNRIEGAVLAMIDIDQMRRAQNAANAARDFAESLIESVQTPLLVLYRDLRVRLVNRAFLEVYGLRMSEVENCPLVSLGSETTGVHWDHPELRAALERITREETLSEELEYEQDIPGSGSRIILIHARQVSHEEGFQILLAATDITAQRLAERIMLEEQARLTRSVQMTSRELEETEFALHGSQEALRRSREELRALSGSLLNAQDEERRRVSRELHDDVSQNVAKIQFDIETLEQGLPANLATEKKQLLSIRDTASKLSEDLKKIAYGLHPSTLDHLGLPVALRAYAREFAKRTGIRVKFKTDEIPLKVAPEISSAFYRIMQEALRNVAKHAENSTVTIRLTASTTHLTLMIRDDGPGFNPEAVRGNGGLGLISMEERARLIHANFQLETQPGSSTSIVVSAHRT